MKIATKLAKKLEFKKNSHGIQIKNRCGHFMSKTEYPGVKWRSGINSAAQKSTIWMKIVRKWAKN